MDFGDLLPPRSVEDILAERVRLTIGGEVIDLPTLSIAENRAWKAKMDLQLGLLVALISDTDDLSVVLERFDGYDDTLMDLLLSYDKHGALPTRADIEQGLTPLGLFRAVCEVWRAARPLADIARTGMMTNETATNGLGARMRSWLRNTTGRLGSSSAN